MGRKLLPLAIATVLACVTAATGLAAGSTQVTHFSFTKPSNVCGVSGTTVGHGASVFRDTGSGTYFMSGTFFGVFTADNGKSTTLTFAGPVRQTSPPVIDEQAGTVTIMTTYGGLYTPPWGYSQRLLDAGIVPSRGRTGTALDNAMAESVIATIKSELTKKRVWRTRLDLELALLTYIGWYNQRRLHRSLGGNTPNETAAAYRPDTAANTESDEQITTKTN